MHPRTGDVVSTQQALDTDRKERPQDGRGSVCRPAPRGGDSRGVGICLLAGQEVGHPVTVGTVESQWLLGN